MIAVKQCTLKTSATMTGPGLHTGEECFVGLNPADTNTGIVFVTEQGEVRASVENVSDTQRGTSLRSGDAQVRTVEHLLSALAGLGIDNARVEVRGPELPVGDGSALPFVELIEGAGIEMQSADAEIAELTDPVWVAHEDKYLLAVSGAALRASALISFPHPMIGEQAISLVIDLDTFKREIAPARTFCTADEIEMILSMGLGKGGSKDNVVIVHDKHYSVPLRYPDEFVRHKILDLIGDLSLIGKRLHADVTAIKSSHLLNTGLASRIIERRRKGG